MAKKYNTTYLCFGLDIQEYFVDRLTDDQKNGNYRSLIGGQNYLSSGWVGHILHCLLDNNHIILKGSVRHSQTIHCHHDVEVILEGSVTELYRPVTAWLAEAA